MRKPNPGKYLLTALLAGILLGMTACSNPQPVTASEIPQVGESKPAETAAAAESVACTEENPHPIGAGIAETYEIPYQQVMTWFCSGYSFENILIALETSEAVDVPTETLLEMLLEKEWEEIWVEIGFTGNP